MKTHLFINPYQDKNPERRKELEKVFENNIFAGFDFITFVIEDKDFQYVLKLSGKYPTGVRNFESVDQRPPFQTYIDMANKNDEETINIVCNNDIYITPDNLEKLKNLHWDRKLWVSLARWDVSTGGNLTLLDRPDTADGWAWVGNCNINNANCPIGFAGSDNNLAWLAKESGYIVINPSRDIRIFHLHNVKINNYRDGKGNIKADQICPEPYHFHPPIFISEI